MCFPEDIQYERWLETGQVNTIGDIPIEDWPLEDKEAYDISDPKHPDHYDTFCDISDLAEF